MVAADIVEIDVDPVRRCGGEALEDRARLIVDRPGRRRANARTRISPRRPPSRSRVMPLALAIWTTTDPTAPAAAETKTMSPCLGLRRIEQSEIGGDPGHPEYAEEALGRDAEVGQLLAPCARAPPPRRASRPCAGRGRRREARPPCFRPLRRSRRPPSARRAGTAGRSFSRRSSARACRGRPKATGSGRGPGRRQAAEARAPSARNCRGVGSAARAALQVPGAGHRRFSCRTTA